MAKRVDLLNQPYRPILTISKEKIDTLFMKMNMMDTQDIKQYSIINNVPLNVEDINGDNLIHKVINIENNLKKEIHRLNMIKFLVQNNVNPDKPNKDNQTPLHLACKEQYYDIIKYLISLGVNINYQDNFGSSALHYSLQGKIKLMNMNLTVNNFIKPDKNKNIKKKEDLIVIKKEIWNNIDNNDFIKAIQKTISNSVYSDENITKEIISFYDRINNLTLSENKENYLIKIKQDLIILKNNIYSTVKNIWNEFPKLDNLKIHETKMNSYDMNDKYSPLENIDVKKQIKTIIQNCKDKIKEECKKYSQNKNMDLIEIEEQYFEKITEKYWELYNENEKLFDIDADPIVYNSTFNNVREKFNKISDDLLNPKSVDFADNYIDWKDMIFIGGSREIDVTYNFNDIIHILNLPSIETKVFFILSELTSTSVIQFDKNNTILKNIDDTFNPMLPPYYYKIALAYNIIFNEDMNIIENDIIAKKLLTKYHFFKKWYKLFLSKDKASVLYAMYTMYSCLPSNDNLTGTIKSEFPSLILALKINEIEKYNLDVCLEIAFKKFFIAEVLNIAGKTKIEQIFGAINVLLSEKLDTNLNNYFIMPNLEIFTLLNKLTTIDDKDFNKNYTELQNIITKKINKMEFKPLEQDITMLLTYINNSCYNNALNCDTTYYRINDLPNINVLFNNSTKYYYDKDVNNIIDLLQNKNNTLFLPYLYHLLEHKNDNNSERHSMMKMKESLYLGLYYNGLLQKIRFYDIIEDGPSQIELYNTQHSFTNDTLDDGMLPLFGNYLEIPTGLDTDVKKLDYYQYVDQKYRPCFSIKDVELSSAFKYNIQDLIKKILYNSEKNLHNLIDTNNDEIFLFIYPLLMLFSDLLNCPKTNSVIKTIITNLNTYNSYTMLKGYLFSPDKMYKVSTFNYYELPTNGKTPASFLYFNTQPNPINKETSVIETDEKHILNLLEPKSIYNTIQKGIIKGKYIKNPNELQLLKTSKLPPSIKSELQNFYKYNMILLLTSLYKSPNISQIKNKINMLRLYEDSNNIFNNDSVRSYYVIGKLTEELIREQMLYYIDMVSTNILTKVLVKKNIQHNVIDEILLPKNEFPVNMNNTDITDAVFSSNNYILASYLFSKTALIDNNKFLIYPEEYSNSELLKLKYEIDVNYKIFSLLLENNVNPCLLDSNNQTAIFPILKLHNNMVIKELKKYIDFREFSDLKPFNFLYDEFNNHIEKLSNNTNDFKDWIENFTLYQKNEVVTLIQSNEKFENNVPNYLEESFNVVCYMINQYLSESMYKIDDINIKNDITSLLSLPNNFNEYLHINEMIPTLNIHSMEQDIILQELVENKKYQQSILESKISNLSNGKTKQKLEKEKSIILQDIIKYNNLMTNIFLSKQTIKDNKIINRYNMITNKPALLTKMLSKLVKIDINNSLDLLTYKIIRKEQEILSDINNKLPELKVCCDFYEHTNKLSDLYFNSNKYSDDNKVLEYVKELLEFATKHFICYPYYMLLIKILTLYFNSIFPNNDHKKINDYVNYCLTNELLKDNYKSIKDILYDNISKKLVLNSVKIFNNMDEENDHKDESVKDLLDSVTNLLTINPVFPIKDDSPFYKTIAEINLYFDTFVNKTILNWLVIIENVFKFNINQGRIVKSTFNLFV